MAPFLGQHALFVLLAFRATQHYGTTPSAMTSPSPLLPPLEGEGQASLDSLSDGWAGVEPESLIAREPSVLAGVRIVEAPFHS